jgi:nucleotide-binding universal stress UspA family protein
VQAGRRACEVPETNGSLLDVRHLHPGVRVLSFPPFVVAVAITAEIGGPVPEAVAPVFKRAVIALSGGAIDSLVVRLALEVTRQSHAELIAVHVVELDWTQPLDADVAERSEEAQRVLDAAEAIVEGGHGRLESVLVQARDVGAAIVDEAAARDADLLILGLPYRTRFGGDFAIGRAIPYALKNATCAVWVVREPISEETR